MGLIFDGIDIEGNNFSVPLHVEAKPDYSFPEREYNSVHVPGRNGDILEDIGSYPNVQATYLLSCGKYGTFDYLGIARQIKDWLTRNPGYHVLTDTYEPDVFRFACFRGAGVVSRVTDNGARIQVQFDCMPQKYYKTYYPAPQGTNQGVGILNNSLSNSVNFTNIYTKSGKPLITISNATSAVTGTCNFTFTVGTESVHMNVSIPAGSAATMIYIDCEAEEVYDQNGNRLGTIVTLPENRFPELVANETTTVSASSNTSRTVKLYQRYWTL